MRKIFIFLCLLVTWNALATDLTKPRRFDYINYWNELYKNGGNSGPGSRGFLALYKADVINEFLTTHSIRSTLEIGCGDGYNLSLIDYEQYVGFDVAQTAIQMCMDIYKNDPTKSFMLYDPKFFSNKTFHSFDLVVCLDVLYHIINEDEFIKTLDDIFSFKAPYVILYTTLEEKWNETYESSFNRDILKYLIKYPDYTYKVVENKYKNTPNGSSAAWVFLTRK